MFAVTPSGVVLQYEWGKLRIPRAGGMPERFATAEAAFRQVEVLRSRYPILRGYEFWAV
jgi:hypothetical protein